MPALDHNHDSTRRERLLEHLLVGELLRHAWCHGLVLEVLRPEVDATGYDLVLECGGVIRHVQLKASHLQATTAGVPIHIDLANKPSGCVIWIVFDQRDLSLDRFLFFGDTPGERLTDLSGLKIVKHSRANAQGMKAERPNIRRVPKGRFEVIDSIAGLMGRLFGPGDAPR